MYFYYHTDLKVQDHGSLHVIVHEKIMSRGLKGLDTAKK
jgi:hypothetical protein